MAKLIIYTTQTCPYCIRAKQLLERKRIAYHEIAVDNDPQLRAQMTQKAGSHTVPQIFINDQPIGGCDELHALEAQGRLDKLLQQED
ncbi:MAG: glutaredoxin 3 [Legionellaceae bacterium]|nr:glutaredoxin 3 [Legionellaceae bacterium]